MATPRNNSIATPEAKADSLVIKAASGVLHDVCVVMDQTAGTTKRCVMLFDATSLPANGTDPVWRFHVDGSGTASYTFSSNEPLFFATGIIVAISSTWDDLTVTTAGEGFIHATFE